MEVRITIDDREVGVPQGTTILKAAEMLGIDIPTLCHIEQTCSSGSAISPTSCLVCLVKYNDRTIPACSATVVPGMKIESETEEVRLLRRTALELLLSDHRGDCLAPCFFACPAKLDIPQMLRDLAGQNLDQAIATIKKRIPLPSVLGRICPKPCEKICRRKDVDDPVSICQLKRYIGDSDLGKSEPYIPLIASATGKKVAVLGAGPCGLSAAYYLTTFGHEVTLLEKQPVAGGRLWNYDDEILPQDVLDTEIDHLLQLPITFHCNSEFDLHKSEHVEQIFDTFDAVLLATGPIDTPMVQSFGIEMRQSKVAINPGTFQTKRERLFAAGTTIRGNQAMVVRSVADGREAAEQINHFLHTNRTENPSPPFSVKSGKLQPEELTMLIPNGSANDRKEPEDVGWDDYQLNEAAEQASRCLHCDCRSREQCRLLKWAEKYEVNLQNFATEDPKPLVIKRSGDILFEPGKCIKCGVCVALTKQATNIPGLTFMGRGFDVQVGVPFDETLEQGLGDHAKECANACPTAALTTW